MSKSKEPRLGADQPVVDTGLNTEMTRGPLSRRSFLAGSAALVAGGVLAAAPRAAEAHTTADPPTDVDILNYALTLEPRVTLLEALRNELNLTGAKHVDDTTASGADTVMIDGKAVLASSRLAIECQGKKIKTVESLRNGNDADEVIEGFIQHDAMQCGFCTPGFVMATRAFLDAHPNASLAEIQKGLGGNVCRCGTYRGITQCALEIAQKGGA